MSDILRQKIGGTLSDEQTKAIEALLASQAQEADKRIAAALAKTKEELEKEKSEVIRESIARKERIRELEAKLNDGQSDKDKRAAEEAAARDRSAKLERRILQDEAAKAARSQIDALLLALDAKGKTLDKERILRYLEKHPPDVAGSLDANGRALFDTEALGKITLAVQDAAELFVTEKKPGSPPLNPGGEPPSVTIPEALQKAQKLIWEQNQSRGTTLLQDGLKVAQQTGLIDRLVGTAPESDGHGLLDALKNALPKQ